MQQYALWRKMHWKKSADACCWLRHVFYEDNAWNHCDVQVYLDQREWRHPSLIFSGPQTLRWLRDTERRGGAARATPSRTGRWSRRRSVAPNRPAAPGAAAVLMIRAALEAMGVGLIQANGSVIRGPAADVRGRAEPLSRCGHRRSCGAAGHRPPPRARPGADARAPPRTPGSAVPRRTALSLRRAAMPCLPRWGCRASPAGVSRSGSAAAGRRNRPR